MMSKEKRLYSLKTLLGIFIGSLAIVLIIGSVAIWRLTKDTRLQMISLSQGLNSVLVAEQLQTYILNYDRHGVLYSITQDDRHLRLQEDSKERIYSLLKTAKRIEDKEALVVVEQTKEKAEQYFESRREWQRQKLSPEKFVERNEPFLSELMTYASELTRMDLDQGYKAIGEAGRIFKLSATVNIAIFAVFIVSIFGFFLFTNMYFFAPMRLFTKYLERFALDKKGIDLPPQKSQEAHAIAQSLMTQAEYMANEEKRRLGYIAGVAHDLRSPLSAVLTNFELIELILQQGIKGEKAEEAILRGKNQVEKINTLIDEFLDASKLQAGELKLNIEKCELSSLLLNTVEQWKEVGSKRVFNTEVESVYAKCDMSRMERVFHNLLSNAVKYSEEETPINIKLKKEDGNIAHLVVEDFGSGIPENELEEVFLPFKRSESVDDMAAGTGLGLSNIKMIIEAHGGKVWVESEVGRGSQFHAHIPLD